MEKTTKILTTTTAPKGALTTTENKKNKMQLLYKIKLTHAQRASLTEAETTFVNLFNQFKWAFIPGKVEDHPINIFRNFKNPKGHDLIEEMIYIKKHLIGLHSKRPGSVWRGLDWSKRFQNWLIRTEPRIKPDSLKDSILTQQPKERETQYKDNIVTYLQECMVYECNISQDDKVKYAEYLANIKRSIHPEAVEKKSNDDYAWQLYYCGDPLKADYYDISHRIIIQEITDNDPDIKKYIHWCYKRMKRATRKEQYTLDLTTIFFAEYITGEVVVKKHTKNPF